MATALVDLAVGVTLGGERKQITQNKQLASCTVALDRLVNLANGAPGTTVTLYDAASDLPATFKALVLVIDPDAEQATDLQVDVELTISGTARVIRMDRRVPLLWGPSTTYDSLGGSAGNLTKVRARQIAATADVRVRILILN